MNKIGIDLGGTKIEGIVLDENCNTIDRKRIPTNREDGYEAIINRITGLGHQLLEKSTGVEQIGICTFLHVQRQLGQFVRCIFL